MLIILLSFSFPAGSAPFQSSTDNTLYHLAEQNDPAAQYIIGRKYYTGNTVKKNINEAIKWLELAATQHYTKAQFHLGKIYLYGEEGIKPNPAYAFNYLHDAAKNQYAQAQFELGNYYLMGKAVSIDYPEAVKWYRAAAQQQHVKAMLELGKILYEGRGGVNPQPDEARHFLSMAAEAGNTEAMQYLRDIVRHTSAEFRNAASITEFHTKFNEASAGHIPSQYEVGMAYLKGLGVAADVKLAAKWLRRAAMNDHSEAQYRLSQLYRDGVGIEKNRKRALEWLKIAASAGIRDAQKELRSMHLSGSSLEEYRESDTPAPSSTDSGPSGTPERKTDTSIADARAAGTNSGVSHTAKLPNSNPATAKKQPTTLTSSPKTTPTDPEKQYQMAQQYLTGKDSFKDMRRAAYWFYQAARQNHAQAQYQLGEMYKQGNGVTASAAKAKFWLSKAADSGLSAAQLSLRDLEAIPLPNESDVVKINMPLDSVRP